MEKSTMKAIVKGVGLITAGATAFFVGTDALKPVVSSTVDSVKAKFAKPVAEETVEEEPTVAPCPEE